MMRWLPALLLVAASPLAAQVSSSPAAADVKPGDWAFITKARLVARYGCVSGYPAATYRGKRPLTRYKFAAGLHACRDHIRSGILAAEGPNSQDAADLNALEQQFAPELSTIGGRVDTLEARTSTLEATQFSDTDKLAPMDFNEMQAKSGNKRNRKRPPQPAP